MKEILIFIGTTILLMYIFISLGGAFYLYSESRECVYESFELSNTSNFSACMESLEESNAQKLVNFNNKMEDMFWGRK